MQTNISHSHPPRHLPSLQALYKVLLVYVVISILLNPTASAISFSDIHPGPLKFAGKKAEKVQLIHHDFLERFLKEYVGNANWVSIEGGFSLPIIQQPEGEPSFVSTRDNIVTQFNSPSQYGVTGLLAHNYLSGKDFYSLEIGQKVTVYYGEGIERNYKVISIDRFRKLDRTSIYSNLVEVETNKEYSSTEVFNRFYNGSHHLVFQTCLEQDGRLDWGLVFITAEPIEH